MPCDSRPRIVNQTMTERKEEVRQVVEKFVKGLTSGRVKTTVGPQGAVAFTGLTDEERSGVTDACAYRRIMATGSAMAKMQIQRAEQLAGRSVDKKVLTQGVHSHDGGKTWGSD